ncbi:MAG TPA: ABC transporter [Clostridiales bacterium]|nr:ABC transporter [Clostridiales bacterium]
MEATTEGKPKNRFRRDIVPDYDHLFNEESDKTGKRKTKFLSKIFKMNAGAMTLSSFIYLIQAAPLWIIPIITSNLINVVIDAIAPGSAGVDWAYVGINAGILLISILQNVPSTIARLKIVNKMLRTTGAGIKTSVVKKLQSLSITYHKDMQTGRVQSKFIKDTDSVEVFLRSIVNTLIPNLLSVIAAIVVSVIKNGFVSLFFLLVIPINVALSLCFRKKIRAKNRDYRVKTETMSARLNTMLEMIPVTKSHGLEQNEIASVQGTIDSLKGSGLEMDKTVARFGSMMWVTNNLLSVVCLLFCAFMAFKGYIKPGDIVLFQSMFTSISGYVTALVDMLPQFSTGFEAVRSISEIMSVKDVEVNSGKFEIQDIDGRVEFKDVCYHYPDKERLVIKDFSLKIEPGECIAVVGSSGSGKSTLMNMIIGFLKPTSGELDIDGKNIDDLNLSEYRHHISVVPQNSILFAGSIRENITYGLNGYKEEDFMRVVEMANLPEFVKDLPDGLETNIGEHGDRLSGGQKQRITIARALIRNPKILILDEAISALDNISEYHVQKAIESSVKGRTTFIVAHRLSTIRGADRIVVMENGEAVEVGTYDELVAKKGKFYELKTLNEANLKQAEENLS